MQLREACSLVAAGAGHSAWRLVYQSRSGPPTQPWLEPDVSVVLGEIAAGGGSRDVVVAPIGFISDHLEVLYDVDIEYQALARACGLRLVRTESLNDDSMLIDALADLARGTAAARGWS